MTNNISEYKLKNVNDINAAATTISATNNDTSLDMSIFVGKTKSQFVDMVTNGAKANSSDSIFYKNIETVGAENVFDSLNTNKSENANEDILDANEIGKYSGLDSDPNSFSSIELKMALYDIMCNLLKALGIDTPENNDKALSILPKGQDYYNMPTAKDYTPLPSNYKAPNAVDTPEEKINKLKTENAGLEKEKTDVSTEYDAKIAAENAKLGNLFQADPQKQLGEGYSKLQGQYTQINAKIDGKSKEISAADENIKGLNSEIQSLNGSIAQLTGEKTALQASASTDPKVKTQLDSITKQIDEQTKNLNAKKDALKQAETNKKNLETEKTGFETSKTSIENQMASIKSQKSDSPNIQETISKIRETIKNYQTEKTNKLNAINTKIQTNEAEIVKNETSIGNSKGLAESSLGEATIADARKYIGYNEGDGSYKKFTNGRSEAWCADFVSYVAKETYGDKLPQGFGSPSVSNLKAWGDQNHRTVGFDKVKAGDVMIQQNGASHTGFVSKVDADGTIHTVEGNTSDQVAERTYKPGSNGYNKITCFINLD